MKDVRLLVFISQLGLGVALPLCGFVLLGVWLHHVHNWGIWAIIAGAMLGIIVAIQSLRSILRSMELLSKDKKDAPPPVAFNEHD